MFSRFETFARISSWPLRKGYEEGNVRERDEGWKINKRKVKEDPDKFTDLQICQRFPSTKVEKICEGSAKDRTLKHLNRQLTEKDNPFEIQITFPIYIARETKHQRHNTNNEI